MIRWCPATVEQGRPPQVVPPLIVRAPPEAELAAFAIISNPGVSRSGSSSAPSSLQPARRTWRGGLTFGHLGPTMWVVTGREFIERVAEVARIRGVSVRIDSKRGKGSHVTLYYGSRKTTVKDRRKEISAGLLSAMVRQLGLNRSDLVEPRKIAKKQDD